MIEVSYVEADQAAVLATLHATSFQAPWSEAAFTALLAQPGVFALNADGGFILCRVAADEAEILTLAVKPEVRRAGVGVALVRAASKLAWLWEADRLFLEVAEDNAAANGLYAGLGFQVVGRRPGYYSGADGRRIDAVLMSLSLS